MTLVRRVLKLKIWFTIVWFVCLLFLPVYPWLPGYLSFLCINGLVPGAEMHLYFLRLLGAAYVSLIVGYILALYDVQHGRFGERAEMACVVGAVSNGSACLILLWYGTHGGWSQCHPFMCAFLWVSAGVTGIVTLGLLVSLRNFVRSAQGGTISEN